MKIAIVGAGAVGSYYGARLAVAGNDVHFLLRADYAFVKQHGIKVKSIHGDFHIERINCSLSSEEIGEVDLVIVAWKTTSNTFAEKVISPLVGQNTKILTLQNGLGNVEYLGAIFGRERVMGGLCFVCINRVAPGVIDHSASGLIRIAWAEKAIDTYLCDIVSMFHASRVRCEAVNDLEKALWMKLVWNFPFNGLAIAEGGVDTEVLLKGKKLEPLVRNIMHEVITVGRALGHDIPYSMIDEQIAITTPMGPYRPSSMIDFVEGRPVEYHAIWHKPIEVIDRMRLEAPAMKLLANRVLAKIS